MSLKIKHPQARAVMNEIIQHISQIEVKGDDVEHMYIVRLGLKHLFDSVEETPDDKKETKEKTTEEG